jgi:hypothetical protein
MNCPHGRPLTPGTECGLCWQERTAPKPSNCPPYVPDARELERLAVFRAAFAEAPDDAARVALAKAFLGVR